MSFVEFPKCLYKQVDLSVETLTVLTAEEQTQAQADGWMTVEDIYAGKVTQPAEKKKTKK